MPKSVPLSLGFSAVNLSYADHTSVSTQSWNLPGSEHEMSMRFGLVLAKSEANDAQCPQNKHGLVPDAPFVVHTAFKAASSATTVEISRRISLGPSTSNANESRCCWHWVEEDAPDEQPEAIR